MVSLGENIVSVCETLISRNRLLLAQEGCFDEQ